MSAVDAKDSGLALRMAGWALVLPLLKRVMPLRSLVKLMWLDGRVQRSADREHAIAQFSARLTRLRPSFHGNCLERSLLAYRYLAEANAEPRLVIAVSAREDGVMGHAWVTVDDRPVHDWEADVGEFAPIVEFGTGGLVAKAGRESTCSLPKNWI
jgi:Transglutaminase-like superfamily